MADVLYSQRATNKLLDSIEGLFHPEPVRQPRYALLRRAPISRVFIALVIARALLLVLGLFSFFVSVAGYVVESWSFNFMNQIPHLIVNGLLIFGMVTALFLPIQYSVKQRGIAAGLLAIAIVVVAGMGFKQTMDRDEKCNISKSAGRTPCLVGYSVVGVELVSVVMMLAEAVLTRLTRKEEARRAAQSLDMLAKEQQQQPVY